MKSRRCVLGATAGAASLGLSGCLGILEEQTSNSGDSEEPDEDDEESNEGTETGTDEDSSDSSVIYADDFEDGSLASYDIVEFPGDSDIESYHITTEPSRGEYAVQHRTESKYLIPSEPVRLEPPLTFSMDFYVEDQSGIDILPQWDSERNRSYLVKVRSNASGQFIQVAKVENELSSGESTTLVDDRNENDTFTEETWETVEIDWETDGTLTVTIQSTGESVSISDTELTGHPFVLKGYRYTGSTTFDNIDIR